MADLESDLVERKESLRKAPPGKDGPIEDIRQAVCAFANDVPGHNRPGVVFVGVRDDGTPSGFPITDRLLQRLADIKTDGHTLPPPTMSVERRVLAGHDVAVVTAHPSDAPPVRARGRIRIRVGPRRAIATAQDERILNERRRHRDTPFDLRPLLPRHPRRSPHPPIRRGLPAGRPRPGDARRERPHHGGAPGRRTDDPVRRRPRSHRGRNAGARPQPAGLPSGRPHPVPEDRRRRAGRPDPRRGALHRRRQEVAREAHPQARRAQPRLGGHHVGSPGDPTLSPGPGRASADRLQRGHAPDLRGDQRAGPRHVVRRSSGDHQPGRAAKRAAGTLLRCAAQLGAMRAEGRTGWGAP